MREYIVELFNKKQHQTKNFTCGIEELDDYLRQQVSQETKRKVTVVYIIRKTKSKEVLGYYTLSSNSLELTDLPESAIKKLPRYKSLPTILIGRFAIDIRYQGIGIGEKLLTNALVRSFELSEKVGCFAVIVDAKDENSSNFYEKHGFIKTKNNPLRLYIPMLTISYLIDER